MNICEHMCSVTSDALHSLTGSSVRGILQAIILEWAAMHSSRESSQPRDRTHISCISCIGKQILYLWAIGETSSWTHLCEYLII